MSWWWAVVVVVLFVLWRLWLVYQHPAAVLGRQAASLNWIAKGYVKDSFGNRNTRFIRGGMEVEVPFKPAGVRLISPQHADLFPDFLSLERWLCMNEGAPVTTREPKSLFEPVEQRAQQKPRLMRSNPYPVDDDANAYTRALDQAFGKAHQFLTEVSACESYGDAETQAQLYAWLVVFAATYIGWQDSQRHIYPGNWNSFKRRIENEMLRIKDYGEKLSGTIAHADGTKSFAHFASSYSLTMDDLETEYASGAGLAGIVRTLLDMMDAPKDLSPEISQIILEIGREAETTLVPAIADLA